MLAAKFAKSKKTTSSMLFFQEAGGSPGLFHVVGER